ncbi:MAG: hypothetical protein V1706_09385 [Pseudomonadota bacterium]
MAIDIHYRFISGEGSENNFAVSLDPVTLDLFPTDDKKLPEWAKLGFHQCKHCSLTPASHPFCPAAVAIVPLAKAFEGFCSHDELDVEVTTIERKTIQHTSAQRAIGSLMGLVLAVSGCPHTLFFKPMARFHLPFASEEETIFRALSVYLLGQYFINRADGGADFELNGLEAIYHNAQKVNHAMATRLRAVSETDSSVNAVVFLDMYAKAMPFVLKNNLEEIAYLFPKNHPA